MEIEPRSVYVILNEHLRTNNSIAVLPWFSFIKLLCTAMQNLPSYSGSVWRGVRGNVGKRYKKGTNIYWWSFTSYTKSLSTIQNFLPTAGKGTIFMIECVNGKAISAYSKYRNEDEILLLPGIKLVAVDDALQMFGVRVVHLKEIVGKPRSASLDRPANSYNSVSLTSMPTPLHFNKSQIYKESTVPALIPPPKTPVKISNPPSK